jgi:hypothetical protein
MGQQETVGSSASFLLLHTVQQYLLVPHLACTHSATASPLCQQHPPLTLTTCALASHTGLAAISTAALPAAAGDLLEGALVDGSLVFKPLNSDVLPSGVNVFDPANNFTTGIGQAGVPSGVGNTDSNLNVPVTDSNVPEFAWQTSRNEPYPSGWAVGIKLDLSGLVTLEQWVTTSITPHQSYTITLKSPAFANSRLTGSVNETFDGGLGQWNTTWNLLEDTLTINAPADGWLGPPSARTASFQLEASVCCVESE